MRDHRAAPALGTEHDHQLALHQRPQRLPQLLEIVERLHPARAAAQLALGLRAAQ